MTSLPAPNSTHRVCWSLRCEPMPAKWFDWSHIGASNRLIGLKLVRLHVLFVAMTNSNHTQSDVYGEEISFSWVVVDHRVNQFTYGVSDFFRAKWLGSNVFTSFRRLKNSFDSLMLIWGLQMNQISFIDENRSNEMQTKCSPVTWKWLS